MSFLLPLIIQGPGHKLNSQVSRKVKVNYDVHVQLFLEPQLFFLSKIHKKHNFKIMAKSLYAHRDASNKSKLSKYPNNIHNLHTNMGKSDIANTKQMIRHTVRHSKTMMYAYFSVEKKAC